MARINANREAARALAAALLSLTLVMGANPRAATADEPAQVRVVGGSESGPSQFPWAAAIVVHERAGGDEAVRQFCGGSLVASRVVVTAAHCLLGRGAADIQVVLGRSDLRSTGGEVIDVAFALTHPLYHPTLRRNDVALLHLSSPSQQAPIALIEPGQASLWTPWQPATVAGWGASAEGSAQSPVLRTAGVSILPRRTCSRPAAYGTSFDRATMLCAGTLDGSADGCTGDSGGSLAVPEAPWRLVGVVSWGRGCGRAGTPGVYTRLGDPSINAWTRAATAALLAGETTSEPPRTAVRKAGSGKRGPSYRLRAAGEPWAAFQCSLRGSRFRPCSNPTRPRVRDREGKGTLRARAIDIFGGIDPTPARVRF